MNASFVDSNIWLYALAQPAGEDKDAAKRVLALQTIQPGVSMQHGLLVNGQLRITNPFSADRPQP